MWYNNVVKYNADKISRNILCIGAAMGKHRERPPPRNGKNCCRKMMLFPKALFVAITFPKIVKNSIFLLNFYQNFSNISQNFVQKFLNCVCRTNARKIKAWFVRVFEKYAKIMAFSQFS